MATPESLRTLADQLEVRALDALRRGQHDRAQVLAAEAELARMEAGRLTGTKQPRTVRNKMAATATAPDQWRKPPTLSELARMLGCHRSFLTQAKGGLTRIRLSWAERIAAVRPDMPATTKTWPKGWAPEEG